MVDLYIWDEIGSDEQLAMLVPIVLSVRPKCLRLAVEGLKSLGGVMTTLRNIGFEALQTLHIVFKMYEELYTGGTALDLTVCHSDGHQLDLELIRTPLFTQEFIFEALKLLPPQVTTLELFIEFKGNYIHSPKPDSRALKELGRRVTEAAPALTHVLVRHADGYRLQPPNGLRQESDESDSDYGSDWGYEDSDGYDSDFAERCQLVAQAYGRVASLP